MSSNKKTTTKANSWWTFCWMTGESVGRFEGPWGSQRKAESEAKWCRRSSKLLACCATKHREVPSGMTASN